MPFGGREAELARLDAWLVDETAAPRRLLVAPAGRGKSALVVRWMERLQAVGRVGDAEGAWRLVFVPVSMRFGTNRPEVALEMLAAGLAHVLGEELRPAHGEPVAYYEDQARRLCDRAVEEAVRVLIVLDGLDEALGGNLSADWFPRRPGPRLRLLATARQQLGDDGPEGWASRLGWLGGVRVVTEGLGLLSPEGVRDLLVRTGAPLDLLAARPGIVDRLRKLAEGEPLLLRLYAEDLWRRGETVARLELDDLGRIRPGFAGYFEDWLERQKRAWREERGDRSGFDEAQLLDRLYDHLAVLACAYGPLGAEEIAGLLRRTAGVPPGQRLEDALYPLRRFVIGSGRTGSGADSDGYILSHPKFGEFLRDYFNTHKVDAARQAFTGWGLDVVDRLNRGELAPAGVPAYLVEYLPAHLAEGPISPEVIGVLTSEAWLKARRTLTDGIFRFAADVGFVADTLSREANVGNGSLLSLRLRCTLVLATLRQVFAEADPDVIAYGDDEDALDADRVRLRVKELPPAEKVRRIIDALDRISDPIERNRLLEEARQAARKAADAATWLALADTMGEDDGQQAFLEQAAAAAAGVADPVNRIRDLVLVAEHDPNVALAMCTATLAAAEEIGDPDERQKALRELPGVCPPDLRGELSSRLVSIFRELEDDDFWNLHDLKGIEEAGCDALLEEALVRPGGTYAFFLLAALASRISTVKLPAWLDLLTRVKDDFLQPPLAAVASRLEGALLQRCIDMVVAVENELTRGHALATLAANLSPETLPAVVPAIRKAASSITFLYDRIMPFFHLLEVLDAGAREAWLREILEEATHVLNDINRPLGRFGRDALVRDVGNILDRLPTSDELRKLFEEFSREVDAQIANETDG